MVNTLGEFIQKERKKYGLTQEFLASKLGISRPTYMQVERGERELTVSEAKKLAAIFDMSLEDFLDGKKNTNLAWKDTVLIPIGTTMDILLDVTNPGDWMAHCHIAEHLQSGMMMQFIVK